jgi:hypothetical protein
MALKSKSNSMTTKPRVRCQISALRSPARNSWKYIPILAPVTNPQGRSNVHLLNVSWTLMMALCLLSCTPRKSPPQLEASTADEQSSPPSANIDRPPILKLRGTLKGHEGNRLTGVVGVLFTIYEKEDGGSPLWLEVQNVQVDDHGRFLALVGNTKSDGIAPELFGSEKTRWLGMQVLLPGEAEQPRIRLVSTPEGLIAEHATWLVIPQQPIESQGTSDAKNSSDETLPPDRDQNALPKRSLGDRRRIRRHSMI